MNQIMGEYPQELVPVDVGLLWGVSIIRALRDIHSRNVVHGNVFATNIYGSSDYSVKLVDFQFAKIVDKDSNSFRRQDDDANVMREVVVSFNPVTPSYRNDVYNGLVVLGSMMFGSDFEMHLFMRIGKVDPQSDAAKRLLKWTVDFDNPVYKRVDDLAFFVAMLDPQAVPDYEALIAELQSIARMEIIPQPQGNEEEDDYF